jgi:hypothetical protein
MSGEAALVGLLLFMIFPPMITQFLFAILPGWTMKTLVSRNLVGFLYTLCITAAVAGLDCIMVRCAPLAPCHSSTPLPAVSRGKLTSVAWRAARRVG